MSGYKQTIYKSLENVDQLYEVIFDAYLRGVVLTQPIFSLIIFL